MYRMSDLQRFAIDIMYRLIFITYIFCHTKTDFIIAIIIIIIIIIIFCLYPRYLESRGLKAYSKNSWSGHLSRSHTKLSRTRTELKRWRVIARRWKRKVDSRRSLDLVLILRPKCRNESNGGRVRSAHIFKCYIWAGKCMCCNGQIGILFAFSWIGQFSRCTGRIAIIIFIIK